MYYLPHLFALLLYFLLTSASASEVLPTRPAPGYPGKEEMMRRFAVPPYDLKNPPFPATYSDEEKQSQRQRGKDMVARLLGATKRGDKEHTIAPGVYRINNAIEFWNLTGFTLTAKDVEIVMEPKPGEKVTDKKVFFGVNRCRDVTIKGPLVLDHQPNAHTQGTLLSLDRKTQTIEFRIHDGYEAEGLPPQPGFFIYAPDGTWLRNCMQGGSELQYLGERRIRMKVHLGDYDNRGMTDAIFKPGNLIGLRFVEHNALNYSYSENIRVEDLSYFGGGFLIIEHESQDSNFFTRVRCMRRPGTNRLAGVAGSLQYYLKGGPVWDGCEIAHTYDDAINVCTYIHMVFKQESPTTVLIKQKDPRPEDPILFKVGSSVEFFDFKTLRERSESTIAKVEPLSDPAMLEAMKGVAQSVGVRDMGSKAILRVTFDKPVEAQPTDLAVTSDLRPTDVIVRNCYFHDIMCRALVNGATGVTFENNVFERMGLSPIKLDFSGYWMEGGPCRNAVIRNNLIIDGHYTPSWTYAGDQHLEAISIGAGPGDPKPGNISYPFENITVEGNTIITPSLTAIAVKHARGVKILNNRIVDPVSMPFAGKEIPGARYFGENPLAAIFVESVDDCLIQGNTIEQVGEHCPEPIKTARNNDAQAKITIRDNTISRK